MTFKEYIHKHARPGPNARGDFIRDARADSSMPDNFSSWPELRRYLSRMMACDGAIEGGHKAWHGYQSAKRRLGDVLTWR